MPSKIRYIRRINWKKLDLHDDINEIALMIRKDIRDGIASRKDINDKSFVPLASSTIASKGHDRVLWDTETMQNLPPIVKATKGKLIAQVHVAKARTSIGMYHNKGTSPYQIKAKGKKPLSFKTDSGWVHTRLVNHPGLPKREWFGIGKRGLAKIRQFTALAFAEKLKRK